jgi:hypothetical protein
MSVLCTDTDADLCVLAVSHHLLPYYLRPQDLPPRLEGSRAALERGRAALLAACRAAGARGEEACHQEDLAERGGLVLIANHGESVRMDRLLNGLGDSVPLVDAASLGGVPVDLDCAREFLVEAERLSARCLLRAVVMLLGAPADLTMRARYRAFRRRLTDVAVHLLAARKLRLLARRR